MISPQFESGVAQRSSGPEQQTFDLSTSLVRKGCVGEGGIAVAPVGVHQGSGVVAVSARQIRAVGCGTGSRQPATKIVSRIGGTARAGPAHPGRERC